MLKFSHNETLLIHNYFFRSDLFFFQIFSVSQEIPAELNTLAKQ